MSIRIPYNLRRFFTMYTYAFHQWLSFFYIYSFFGWIFESCYVSIKSRRLVNRGFLRLPMLPLYGTGAVMMLWVSLPLQDSIAAVYLAGTIAASILEYVTGYVMERLFKMKYWDYSHLRFQINGYVSLGSSLTWGLLTILLTEWVHRPISDFVLGLSPWIEFPVLAVLTVLFMLDAVQSTREALDLGRALEAMTRMKAEAEELQLQLALLKAETSQKVSEFKENAAQRAAGVAARAEQLQENAAQKAADMAAKAADWQQREALLSSRLGALREKRLQLYSHMSFYRRQLLKGNPTATSRRFAEALKELRSSLDR